MKYLANILSLGNAVAGVAAVVLAISGNIDIAVRLIFFAFFLDAVDGTAARHFGSTANGKYIDMLSDRVSQGIAPAVVLAAFFEYDLASIFLATAFVIISFVSIKFPGSPEHFSGLPLSVVTLVILGGAVMSGMDEYIYFIGVILPFVLLSGSFFISYPRRLSRPTDNKEREPLFRISVLSLIVGRTWILRAVGLLVLTLLPLAFWPLVGLVIFVLVMVYTIGGLIFSPILRMKNS